MKLDDLAMCRYCYNVDGEAWSMAHSRHNGNFLQFCGINEPCQVEASEDKNLTKLSETFVMKNKDTNFGQSGDSGVSILHPSSGLKSSFSFCNFYSFNLLNFIVQVFFTLEPVSLIKQMYQCLKIPLTEVPTTLYLAQPPIQTG